MMPPRRNNVFSAGVSLVALAWLLIAAIGAIADPPATAPSFPLPPRSLFVATSPTAAWLVRESAGEAGTRSWTVLWRATSSPNGAWTPFASLTARPQSIAPFGERLAVLYEDGSWAIVSVDSQISGPQPSGGWRLGAVIAQEGRLTFLAWPTVGFGRWQLFDFDGQNFSAPRPQSATQPHPLFIDEGVDTDSDQAVSSDGLLQANRRNGTALVTVVTNAGGATAAVDMPPALASQRLTISHDESGAARFWWTEKDRVLSRAFSLDDGAPIGTPVEATLLAPPTPSMFERGLYVVGALTLVLVLFAGGRRTVAAGRVLTPVLPPRPAPLPRRLAAGIVDAIPLAACVAYLVAGDKLTIFAGMLHFENGQSQAILTAGVLFYLMLLFAFELQWQRSIGKAIFALRVVAIDGGKPRPVALLVRNVLRLVDLNLVTLLFVPVTPLRQRLGDFLAGTMVVDAIDADATEPTRVTPDGRRDNK